jgi:hypothetical protein
MSLLKSTGLPGDIGGAASYFREIIESPILKYILILQDVTHANQLQHRVKSICSKLSASGSNKIEVYEIDNIILSNVLSQKTYSCAILIFSDLKRLCEVSSEIQNWRDMKLQYSEQLFASFGGTSNRNLSKQKLTFPPLPIVTISDSSENIAGVDYGTSYELFEDLISWRSSPNENSSPILSPLPLSSASILHSPSSHLQLTGSPRPLRILLVEDSLVLCKLFGKAIEKAGYTLDIARHGLEAIKKIQVKDYDVILMDVNMPFMTGIEATIEVRKSELQQVNGTLSGKLPYVYLRYLDFLTYLDIGRLLRALFAGSRGSVGRDWGRSPVYNRAQLGSFQYGIRTRVR